MLLMNPSNGAAGKYTKTRAVVCMPQKYTTKTQMI